MITLDEVIARLDALDYERLILEGKDPREILHYKYSYVPENIIDKIIEIDPTKKKTYSQWLLSKWNSEKDLIVKNLQNGRIEKLFQHYKTHPEIQIKDCPSVEVGLRFVPEEDTVLTKSDKPMTYVENLGKEVPSELANDFDIVFNEDNWIIAVPNTYEAECKLGENTHWCTANYYGDGLSYYKRYLSEGGKYYVNFDMTEGESRNGKDYPFTRYQFHFESRQFMDINDDSVEFYNIGMPDSAIEFYKSEGYGEGDFEDFEAKQDAYDEWRGQYCFSLNDDLYLCFEYDNDFDRIEVDENTSFFVFDKNDDRDPISWDALPNPHKENIIIETKNIGNYHILKQRNSNGYVFVYHDENGSRDWSTETIDEFFEVPDTDSSIFVRDSRNLWFYSNLDGFNKLNIYGNIQYISVNKYVYNEDNEPYVEICYDNGKHSLYCIDENEYLDTIVECDIPINGKYFVVNDEEIVEGEFRKYKLYCDWNAPQDDLDGCHLVSKLSNGNFVVAKSFVEYSEYIYKQNVYDVSRKAFVFDDWFTTIAEQVNSFYLVKNKKTEHSSVEMAIFNPNGQILGKWHDNIIGIDRTNLIVVGCTRARDAISLDNAQFMSLKDGTVFAEFDSVLRYVNGHAFVVDKNEVKHIYDYINRQFVHQEFEDIKLMWSSKNDLKCKIVGENEYIIYKLDEKRITAVNVANIGSLASSDHLCKLAKTNGKYNVYDSDISNGKNEILPNDVDEIISIGHKVDIIPYRVGDRYFIYDYQNKKMLTNPNGTQFAPFNYYSSYCGFKYGIYLIYFRLEPFTLAEWVCGDLYSKKIDNQTPQEIINMYNDIMGTTNQITEQFNGLLTRMGKIKR